MGQSMQRGTDRIRVENNAANNREARTDARDFEMFRDIFPTVAAQLVQQNLYRHQREAVVPTVLSDQAYSTGDATSILRKVVDHHDIAYAYATTSMRQATDLYNRAQLVANNTAPQRAHASSSRPNAKSIDHNKDQLAEQQDRKALSRQDKTVSCEICCEDAIPMKRTTQCQKGHRFCMECARRMAVEQIGLQRTDLPCMAIKGCESAFSEQEARRFLEPTTLDLWWRIKQRAELKAANIRNLEWCPFCEYAVIMDDSSERLFTCCNDKCSKTSCRKCKEAWHQGKSCADAARERSMNDTHRAEENLAERLIRRCPQCQAPIVKDEKANGCNKMECSQCHCSMCYVCRIKVEKQAYDHFEAKERGTSGKCPLYDDTAARHRRDVEAAREDPGQIHPSPSTSQYRAWRAPVRRVPIPPVQDDECSCDICESKRLDEELFDEELSDDESEDEH